MKDGRPRNHIERSQQRHENTDEAAPRSLKTHEGLTQTELCLTTDGVHRTGSQEMRTTDESALRSCGAVLRNENHSRSCSQIPDCPRVLHAHRNEYHNRGCTQSCAHVVKKILKHLKLPPASKPHD